MVEMEEWDGIIEDPARMTEDADRMHGEEQDIGADEEHREESAGQGFDEWEGECVMEVHVD